MPGESRALLLDYADSLRDCRIPHVHQATCSPPAGCRRYDGHRVVLYVKGYAHVPGADRLARLKPCPTRPAVPYPTSRPNRPTVIKGSGE